MIDDKVLVIAGCKRLATYCNGVKVWPVPAPPVDVDIFS